ncbi:ImpA family metalloprotease [Cellvibrio sp. OA-2007]|uniref:ImpA family metalloprotease n=1 Tax=Cellvibrio sp. OA-2007 TaxID=529823 RepID=UPI000784EE77|nr:ImpA family metalloprotease [Cellvibrio sp. OA-2007]
MKINAWGLCACLVLVGCGGGASNGTDQAGGSLVSSTTSSSQVSSQIVSSLSSASLSSTEASASLLSSSSSHEGVQSSSYVRKSLASSSLVSSTATSGGVSDYGSSVAASSQPAVSSASLGSSLSSKSSLSSLASSKSSSSFSSLASSKSNSSFSSASSLSSVSSSAVGNSNLSAALQTGNASSVTKPELLTAIQQKLNETQTAYASTKQALFGLNSDGSPNSANTAGIDWNPGTSSIYLQGLDLLQNQSALPNNWAYGSDTASTAAQALALVGAYPASASNATRYAVFGGHPFGVPGNSGMNQFMLNTVQWLTKRSDFSGLKVVVAQQPNSFESATRTWLATNYAGVTINGISANPASQANNLCDNANLSNCLQGADLLIIGQDTGSGYSGATLSQALNTALTQGVPVLYTHSAWSLSDISTRVFDLLGISSPNSAGNFYTRYGLKSLSPASLSDYPAGLENIQPLLNRLEQGTFTTTWSGCASNVGTVSCTDDALYMSEFGTTAAELRARIRALDSKGIAIFSASGYELEKLLILLGDKYRQAVTYSSTFKKETYPTEFLRSLFSDVTSYMTRSSNTVAQNLGNFSGLFASNIATFSQTITVAPPQTGSTEYATGLYILPGKTVTLTRTDSGTGSVTFGVNILRDTSRPFNVMDRPTQLGSPRPALAANSSLTITNPYGGPLYLFVGAASGQPDVSVQVSNVISHPVLRNPNDVAEVAAFQQALSTTPTNWVVMATEMVTLHSNLPKFNASLSTYSNSLTNLVADTWTYFIKDTYELAGFNSSSGAFSLSAEVAGFCANKGWDCTGAQHRRDQMQHVVADEWALCGAGCAGNPYDQNWAFGPLGWGETHEVGHNLQVSRLKIYDGISGEVSNNIFPIHKHIKYNQAKNAMVYEDRSTISTNQPVYCTDKNQSVAACVFSIMKSAQGDANPTQTVYNAIWSNSAYAVNNSERVLFYRQLVEFANYYNTAFDDGWELYTLMYLLQRNFGNSSGSWAANASALGFGTYASYPSSMNGNDFMVIAASNIIGRDMRPVFDLWGVTYSAAASAQVNAYSLPVASKFIFPMKSLSTYGSGVGSPVVVTTTASYPAGF